jgi:hypothetical protein
MQATQATYIKRFRDSFALGIEHIVKAAQVYVEAIDENPKFADVFAAEFQDSIPASAWSSFEAVGRKWMHPKLLLGGGGKYANKIKRLPYSLQERIFSGEKFELLTADGDILKVDIREATQSQVEQLIDFSHTRTKSEQKAYIEAHKQTCETKPEILPYVITDGKVSFRRGTILTRNEVKRLLQEM